MKRLLLAVPFLLAAGSTPAAAGYSVVTKFCGDRYCGTMQAAARKKVKKPKRKVRYVRARKTDVSHLTYTARKPNVFQRYAQGMSTDLKDVTPVLAAKIRKIAQTCGSKVVSAFRPGANIAGSHRRSLHARYPAEAVDIAGNPGCAYKLLRDWPGGVSTDYGRVKHIHISLASDRRERGARFAHYRGAKKIRYAEARNVRR